MFADDIELVKSMCAKYGARGPFVDVGGLARPTIAQYETTIAEMAKIPVERWFTHGMADENIRRAQYARYQNIERPLSFLGEYEIENPEMGGLPIERLKEKYDGTIGTAILLSVLEHVSNPFVCERDLHPALRPGGIVIVSVPFEFPAHYGPEDNFRFSPSGLRHVFGGAGEERWEILESGWRLDVRADAGVLDVKTGRPQAIRSCYLAAMAR